jgi:membrane-bound lytic murein transglycosylase D
MKFEEYRNEKFIDSGQSQAGAKLNKEQRQALEQFNMHSPIKASEEDFLSILEKMEGNGERIASDNFEAEGDEKDDGLKNSGRRGFLKWAAVLGAAVVTGGGIRMFASQEKENKDTEKARTPTEKQVEIEEENFQSIEEIIDFNKEGRIEFDLKNVEALRNYWYKRYQDDPKLRKSLEDAYYEMGAWKEYLQSEFEKIGFAKAEAEKYIYLAIPESHWQLKARSRTGAVGPYQFMPKTARSYGLNSGEYEDENQNLDERMDPVLAARACAKHLMDIRHKTGDMNVSLSGYNGGFVWDYIRNGGKDYKGFVAHMEKKVNDLRDEIKNGDSIDYTVRKGDTLLEIAQKHNCETKSIAELNSLQNANIKEGRKLRIPLGTNNRNLIYRDKIAGLAENMVYPAKFDAVSRLIESQFVTEKKDKIKFKSIFPETKALKTHKVKRGDNLWRLSFNYGVSQGDIMTVNNLSDKDIKLGQELKIPDKKQLNTLAKIARYYKTDIRHLVSINPSILDIEKPIPDGTQIRY